ncbi:MAG: glycosyltransferase family 39 protein [Promethearchaeota archaeon]
MKGSSIRDMLKDAVYFILNLVWYNKTRFKLFLLTLIVYSFSISHYYAPDESSYWLLTVSITDFHSLHIDQAMKMYTPWKLDSKMGIGYYNGHYYSTLPPGQSFIAIPFFLIGKGIWRILVSFGINMSYISVTYIPMAMLSSISAVLTIVVFHNLLTELKFDNNSALLTTIILAFGTTTWIYAKTFYAQSLSMFLNFFSIYTIILATKYEKPAKYFLAGIVLGLAATVRLSNILLVIPILIYLILKFPKIEYFVLFIVGTLPPLALLLLYNFLCFDNPFITGYYYDLLYDYTSISSTFSTNPLVGFHGLLFSPGRGLFVYSPVLILSVPGFFYFFKSHKDEAILFILSFIAILLFYSTYTWWHGGLAFGPRFLTDVIPLFVLPLGKTLEKFSSTKYFWILFYIILGFSIFTQAIGALTSPLTGIQEYALPAKIEDLARNGPDILIYNLIKNN